MNRFYAWWLVKTGKAIDIWSKSKYPANILSNLHDSVFIFDDVECHSMEGFLQSLKYQDEEKQRQICKLRGADAKRASSSNWQRDQIVWWKGKAIDRQSKDFLNLVTKAYTALYQQNQHFRDALMATKEKRLLHSRGKQDSYATILTEQEFCSILTELRDSGKTVENRSTDIISNIAMYYEFMGKDKSSILEYLDKLGWDSRIYSEKRKGLGPFLMKDDFFIYATETELALILVDYGCDAGEAKKEKLAFDLSFTCELFRNRLLRLTKNVPHIFGVLVTADLVSDYEAMQHVWETLDIHVICSVKGLDNLSLPVNTDENHPLAFPMMFLYEAEFTEEDYANAKFSLAVGAMDYLLE